MNLRRQLHSFLTGAARWLGSDIVDYQTGRKVARAFMICLGGRVYLLGLRGEDQVIPVFLPQKRMAVWKREIGFTIHPLPDFPSDRPPPVATSGVCHVMIVHLPAEQVERLVEKFLLYCPSPSQLVVCYGGPEDQFSKIRHPAKLYLDDPRMRTREHQREKQSYTQVFQKVAAWLPDHPELAYVYVGEYDHWPVVDDFHVRLIERLKREQADVLAHELFRRDGTSCSHYLSHLSDPRFLPWLREISRRQDKSVVLNMLGTGSFWTRKAFLEVGAHSERFPMYLELYLPTLAHHLGFRVRDFQEQSLFVRSQGDRYDEIPAAQAAGAWTIHPVKTWPGSSG